MWTDEGRVKSEVLLKNYVYVSPRPWGKVGHLDLLWFTVTQMCVCVRPSSSASVCATLCLQDISYSFSPMALTFSDMMNMDKTFN